MAGLVRVGGVVDISLSPPMGFIEAQHGSFREHLRDLSGLWRRFSFTMEKIELERFGTSGYGEWAPLAESTLVEKERHGFPPFPLIRTGDLYESLTDAERAARMDPQQMSWGTDVPYAEYHQEGGRDPGRPPQRKVLDIRVADRRRLETDMVSWLNDIAREAFGATA